MTRLALLIVLALTATPLQAAGLSLCDGVLNPAAPGDFHFNTTDGATKTLRLEDHETAASCATSVLPISAGEVHWFTLLNGSQAAQIGQAQAVSLQGVQRDKHFAGEVTLDTGLSAPPKPEFWPLYLDLRDQLDITAFGQEERATLERNETGLKFRCLAGHQPAGFVFHFGLNMLPPLQGVQLNLTQRSDGRFIWNSSNIAAANHSDPLPLAELQAGAEWRTQSIDLAPMLLPHNQSDSWTLLCPKTQANLTINNIQLTAPAGAKRGRATWLWREATWQQAQPALWKQLRELNITTLYITIPLVADLTSVAEAQAVRAFVTHAGKQGIAVWAVAGDPQAVLASERESWLKRAKAYAAYNRDADKSARLKGVQYDIEPYLAPGYAEAPEVWKRAYVDTLAALHKVSPLPLEVAVPVWWAGETLKDKLLLEAMAPWVDSVAVMDYRTDPWRIQQQVIPFLAWGIKHGKQVHVALEAGPVGDETRLAFRRSESGELWAASVGDTTLLLRLGAPAVNPHGATFTLTRESIVTGEAVSFHGQKGEMAEKLPQLERALGAWTSFSGLALHEALTP